MLRLKSRPSKEPGARAALRLATHDTHQRMHGLEPFAHIAAGRLQISDYRQLLQSLFQFHSAVAEVARRGGWSHLSSSNKRLELLRSDLAFLGDVEPSSAADWQVGPAEAALGTLYAAEGSMLGGRIIARQLDYMLGPQEEGRRFFIGHADDRANWACLIGVLEDACDQKQPLQLAVNGALRTFDLFEKCIARFKPEPVQRPWLGL